jgi:pilus assembly protein Flp/PilA
MSQLKHLVAFTVARRQRGATAIEYGLIVGLIAVVIAAILVTTGGDLTSLFTSVNTKLTSAAGG